LNISSALRSERRHRRSARDSPPPPTYSIGF
jgi:hypothetical protein